MSTIEIADGSQTFWVSARQITFVSFEGVNVVIHLTCGRAINVNKVTRPEAERFAAWIASRCQSAVVT